VSASFLNNYNVSTISYFAPSLVFEDANLSAFTRVAPSSMQEADAIATLMRTLNWTLGKKFQLYSFLKKSVILLVMPIFTNDTLGSDGRIAFTGSASRSRLRTTCTASLPYATVDSESVQFARTINSTVTCIATSIANVVLLWTDAFNAAYFIGQLYATGTTGKVFLFPDFCWQWTLDPQEFADLGNFPLSYLKGSIGIVSKNGDRTFFKAYFG
jgi:Receptor family ligand binding region